MGRGVREVFTPGVVSVIAVLLIAAGVGHALAGTSVEVFRQDFALRLLFFVFAAWALYHGLKGAAVTPQVRYPRAESAVLIGGVIAFVALIGFVAGRWQFPFTLGNFNLVIDTVSLAEWLLVGLALVAFRPRRSDLGITRFSQFRNWLLVLFIGAVGYLAIIHLDFTRVDRDLADLPGRLVLAVLPAALFYRVLLQTRLETLVPVGWAILIQAVLFHIVRIPLLVYVRGESWPVAALDLFPHLVSAVLAGIVWHRTRSLYPVVLLQIFLMY